MTDSPDFCFTLDATELRKALSLLSKATDPRRSKIAILRSVVFFRDLSGKLTAKATNLDQELVMNLEATEVVGRGLVAMEFGLLSAILQRQIGALRFTATEGGRVTVEADGFRCDFTAAVMGSDYPARDIPAPGGDGKGSHFTEHFAYAPESDLHGILRHVMPCVSNEETRYYLNGVFFTASDDGSLLTVATDGHRLARLRLDGIAWLLPSLIVPLRALRLLGAFLRPGGNAIVAIRGFWVEKGGEKGPVHWLEFSAPGWRIQTKTIDGTYPNYDRIIPKPENVDRLEATLTRAAIMRLPSGGSLAQGVEVIPAAGVLRSEIVAFGAKVAMETRIEPGKGDGGIGFNARYLRDLASRYASFTMMGREPGDATLMVVPELPNLTFVLMPMRV